ncbi:Uncharacterised protein [Mycobacteroides abscessus subsp. abscessus]|nr:Uncharacterised protein [Mycobacteroides abscessus subsp. abscessus]
MCRRPVIAESPDCLLRATRATSLISIIQIPTLVARSLVVCCAATAAVAVSGWIIEAVLS